MGSLASLRASDDDRERAADRLREATSEGRLTPDELEERLTALYRSRTYGELDALVADLPVPVPTRREMAVRRPFPRWLIGAAVGTALLSLLSALAGGTHHAMERRGGHGLGLPGGPGDVRHVLIAGAAVLTVLTVLLVCVAVTWVVRRANRPSGA